jgi:hypothetical protein
MFKIKYYLCNIKMLHTMIQELIKREIGVRPEPGTCIAGNYFLPLAVKNEAQAVTKRYRRIAKQAGVELPTVFDIYAHALKVAIAAGGHANTKKPARDTMFPMTESTLVYIPYATHDDLSLLALTSKTTLQAVVPMLIQQGLQKINRK